MPSTLSSTRRVEKRLSVHSLEGVIRAPDTGHAPHQGLGGRGFVMFAVCGLLATVKPTSVRASAIIVGSAAAASIPAPPPLLPPPPPPSPPPPSPPPLPPYASTSLSPPFLRMPSSPISYAFGFGLGLGVWGSGFRAWGSAVFFMVYGLRLNDRFLRRFWVEI